MFSISESQERAEAEGQEEGAVAQQLPSPGKAHTDRLACEGLRRVCLEPLLRMK